MDGFCLSITSSLRLLGSSPRTSVRQDVGRLRLTSIHLLRRNEGTEVSE